MKLGALKGEKAIEVIADLIGPIANIAADNQNLRLFHAQKKDGETDREMAVRDLTEKIPLLLRTHKKDVLAILCAVEGRQPEELNVLEIIRGALELANDPEFLSLFFTAVSSTDGQTPPSGSSAEADHSKPES